MYALKLNKINLHRFLCVVYSNVKVIKVKMVNINGVFRCKLFSSFIFKKNTIRKERFKLI